ncbi:Crp/Fnr family transcriptional regulator [Tissierella carlieri]|uniref:Crp/Fnr family transcriptional regulator n=1 Tax=Tissierella carlieri TaxID=689904 RepID=A0ABT1SG97_9FIRM|nr:Crp/Fnr family transcriptional regulator [Tissierella carlieri]MCQ4925424.1 Crp/Fnr family transcriptional regulator [Tissierella carlieri]
MEYFNYIDIILSISLFKDFNIKELSSILIDKYLIQSYGKNEIIYLQNEKAITMDIILEGEVIVQSIDKNGNILSIVSLSGGDMLGGNLIFSSKNEYPMTIIAKTNTKLLQIKKDLVLELCQENKIFLAGFLEILSDKALVLTTKIHSLAMKTIREKIMDFLLFESNRQNCNIIKLSLSKKDLAEKFGVERPSLQRELRKMKNDGIIDYDSRSIVLKKR